MQLKAHSLEHRLHTDSAKVCLQMLSVGHRLSITTQTQEGAEDTKYFEGEVDNKEAGKL